MIQRFSFGHPIPTESVVQTLPLCEDPVPFLTALPGGWQYKMQENCVVYGLGEMPRGLNKRGWHYVTTTPMKPATARISFPTMVRTIFC